MPSITQFRVHSQLTIAHPKALVVLVPTLVRKTDNVFHYSMSGFLQFRTFFEGLDITDSRVKSGLDLLKMTKFRSFNGAVDATYYHFRRLFPDCPERKEFHKAFLAHLAEIFSLRSPVVQNENDWPRWQVGAEKFLLELQQTEMRDVVIVTTAPTDAMLHVLQEIDLHERTRLTSMRFPLLSTLDINPKRYANEFEAAAACINKNAADIRNVTLVAHSTSMVMGAIRAGVPHIIFVNHWVSEVTRAFYREARQILAQQLQRYGSMTRLDVVSNIGSLKIEGLPAPRVFRSSVSEGASAGTHSYW